MDQQARKEHQGLENLKNSIRSLRENAEDLLLFLPSWIEMRSIIYFKESKTESSPALDCIPRCPTAVKSVATAIAGKINTNALPGSVASTLRNVGTLGMYSGMKLGMNEIHKRRMDIVGEHLSDDIAESMSLEEMITSTIGDFSSVIDAMTLVNEPMVAGNSGAVQMASSRQFVLKWCQQVNLLLQTFLPILKESMKPSEWFEDWNTTPIDGGPDKQVVRKWVVDLGPSLAAVDRGKKFSDQIALSLQNLLETDAPNSVSSKEEVIEFSKATADPSLGDWLIVNTSDCLQVDGDCGDGIVDHWYRQIDFLFCCSVKVASHIIRFLKPENLQKLDECSSL